MDLERAIFARAERLLGAEAMARIASKRVIVFGVGGVGSWCAEALVRSGVRRLTIVDSDRVSVTNVNRQLMATTRTVGQVKVEVLRERLLEINPQAEITALQQIFTEESAPDFALDGYDYIVDAIDSLRDKASLILLATRTRAKLYSSMGAALKLDPTRVQVAEFWKVKGCPLAAALRRCFKKSQTFPSHKFKCVFSDELLPNLGDDLDEEISAAFSAKSGEAIGNPELADHDWNASKAQINGSLVHITAIFGLTLSGLIVQDAASL